MKKYIKLVFKKIKTPINIFDQNIEKSLEFLNGFSEPKTLIERSYFQYKCQCFQKPYYVNIIETFCSFFLIIPFLLILIIKGIGKKNVAHNNNNSKKAIFILSSVGNVVPDNLKEEFLGYKEIHQSSYGYITLTDIYFFKTLLPYLLSPYFLLKIMYKISIYRNVIDSFSPNAVICTSEYSFTSSVLTEYCNSNLIEHINVMHGDKLLNIRDSFFHFNRCYVWDNFYVSLFSKLRGEKNQFRLGLPPSHISLIKAKYSKDYKYELTYYLGFEKKDVLKELNKRFVQSKIPLHKICIRLHPRYSEKKIVEEIFNDTIVIEDFKEVKLDESLKISKRAVSLYSTVLFQAYLMKKEFVIDDITQKDKFKKLHNMCFIIFNKKYQLLSDIL